MTVWGGDVAQMKISRKIWREDANNVRKQLKSHQKMKWSESLFQHDNNMHTRLRINNDLKRFETIDCSVY